MRHLILFGSFFFTCSVLLGQSGPSRQSADMLKNLQDGSGRGQVKIEMDSLLVANYYKLLAQNSKVSGVPGYRIRIYSESGAGAKEEQQRVRARFLSLYPDIDAYHRYDEPYFKVYVGDCRTESEAIQLYDRIKKDFPNLIRVDDYINLKNKE